jgi:very-short-patch-repair endonuclease
MSHPDPGLAGPATSDLAGTSTPAEAGAAAPRVEQNLEGWKRKLLDLSKRNRLLHFRPTKVSTVTVVDELPVEVFRQLYLDGRAMRFRPAPDRAAAAAPAGNGAPDLWDDADGEEIVEALLPPPEDEPAGEGRPARRHTDDWLQTTLTADRLNHSLRRIADQAQLTREEQGVNTLFLSVGMLHFYEAEASTDLRRAPLLLVPVTLERSSARSAYTLRATDDEALVNPALAEYLRREFGVQLPELPDLETGQDYDPAEWFGRLGGAIERFPRWRVADEIHLGLLSFQKFVMYKDLERHRDAFAAHRLIRQLATRSGRHMGLPADVQGLDLDREHPPESTAQVVDADSSQLRAIAAVARGHDLVLEGPPGTGKSQTITNLIARTLGEGKTVLFVAEKMAALQVVYGRLKGAGLGDFCLEMHAQKANKRSVVQELGRSLDASLASVRGNGSVAPRLQAVRRQLTEYAEAVHTAEEPLGLSPYRGYGRLAGLQDAPVVRLRRRADDLSLEQVEDAVRALRELAAAAGAVGDPTTHPWRDTTRTFYPTETHAEIEELLAGLGPKLRESIELAREVEAAFGLPPIRTLADVRRAADIAEVLGRSPGAPAAVLTSDAWNTAPPLALPLVETGRRAAGRRAEALSRFDPAALDRDHAAEIAVVERLHGAWWRMMSGDFRRVRKAWLALRRPGYGATLAEQAAHLREVDALRRDQAVLRENDAAARALFGSSWNGEESDWDGLTDYILWVVEFRSLCVEHGLREEAARAAVRPQPDLSRVEALQALAREAESLARSLEERVGWPMGYLSGGSEALTPRPPPPPRREACGLPPARGEGEGPAQREGVRALADALARVEELDRGFGAYGPWTAYAGAAAKVAAGPAAELVGPALAGEVAFDDLPAAFERAFFQKWLDAVVERRPALLGFHGLTHEQRVAEFRELDRRVLQENRDGLVNRLRERVQRRLLEPDVAPDMTFLRGQLARSRGHAPLRRTLHEAHRAIKAIKPCFMMSPLTVAQFLDPAEHTFDLVVFDEASQLPAEDAVGAVVRGRQLVVVGDPKQLPPTNFFAVQSGQVEPEIGEDGQPLFDDMESVLEEYMAAGIPKSRLRWHYRSQHESLIAFSNVNFYDAELFTFPSADTDRRSRGLQFVHVADGVYEGAGLNRVEAHRVADAVVEHIRTVPHLSLGVGTFNLRQQIAIQDELELRRRQDPSIEPFFAPRDEGGFFVKNLENIQGDDRDVILLSVTYAKGPDGRLRHNFGPINGENGWRRLNVLTTRSRLRMRVFSSMLGDEINLQQTSAVGARYLREFLLFAERGQLASITVDTAARTESPFEREVFQALTRRGLQVVPQVGVAGYRIDLGVLDDEVDGRFVCGIECDGAAYHSAETARDRDRLRQQVLEGLGWTIHRVWSTDWFKDPHGQIERLAERIEETRRRAREGASHSAGASPQPAGETGGGVAVGQQSETEGADTPPVDASLSEGTATVDETAAAAETGAGTPDTSPVEAGEYRVAQLRPRATAGGVLGAQDAALMQAVWEVAEAEAPVHVDDLAARIAAAWGEGRVGSRIAARIRQAVDAAARRGAVQLRGDFVWSAAGAVSVRSRAGQGIPAERIAPEEFREAVLQVLRARGVLPRRELTAAVRSVFGFARTGARLEEAIGGAIDGLLREGAVGEGSGGLGVRG